MWSGRGDSNPRLQPWQGCVRGFRCPFFLSVYIFDKARHKKVLKAVKGQFGRRKNTIRIAHQAMKKAMRYAYRDRRAKKREFRSLWIQRINAGVRLE